MANKEEKPKPTFDNLAEEVQARLKAYGDHNLLEQFAMFMGTAQVLELSLKQLLHHKYNIDFERIENLTLGQVAGKLEKNGLRPDFIQLLKSVVEYRNYITHSLLVDQIMLHELGAGNARFGRRDFEKGIYEVEQLWLIYQWSENHNAWD